MAHPSSAHAHQNTLRSLVYLYTRLPPPTIRASTVSTDLLALSQNSNPYLLYHQGMITA
jgi:hypothetical protein